MIQREGGVRTINETDAQVADLRAEGRSFALIAHRLDLPNAIDAQNRFLRTMRNSSDAARERLRREELHRLEGLAESLRCRPNLTEHERAALLRSVAQLRDLVRRFGDVTPTSVPTRTEQRA